ncbi:hypothetical protein OG225_43285 (plasmid) [Nocardia sp. NBC_01377]
MLIVALIFATSVICGLAAAIVHIARGRPVVEALPYGCRVMGTTLGLLLAVVTVVVLLLTTSFGSGDVAGTRHDSPSGAVSTP